MSELPLNGELRYFSHTLSPEFKKLHIVPISDVHFGDPLFSEKHFLKTIKYIESTPYAYCVLNGDLLNCVIKSSKGEIYNQIKKPADQVEAMIAYLTPIKDKVLGCTAGNHENRIAQETSFDPSHMIAEALGCPYRPEGMMLRVAFGSGNNRTKDAPYVYWGYMTHGYGGARTQSAKAVKVERTSYFVNSNFYIMSHDHVSNAAPGVYLIPDNRMSKDAKTGFTTGTIRANRKIMVKSNAYLKWGGYGESLGFPPVDLMTPIITLAGGGDDYELGKYPSARAII